MSFFPSHDEDTPPEVDIAKVFEQYGILVSPNRSGNQMVRCPLHEDHTPSCSVHQEKGVWRCHSCGESGSALKMIELMDGVDRNGARAYAARIGAAAGNTGRSSQPVRVGSRWQRGGEVPGGPGPHRRNGRWSPSWRG